MLSPDLSTWAKTHNLLNFRRFYSTGKCSWLEAVQKAFVHHGLETLQFFDRSKAMTLSGYIAGFGIGTGTAEPVQV